MAVLMIMMTSITAFADYPVLTEGELHGINIVEAFDETVTFVFTSDETTEYVLCSYYNGEDDERKHFLNNLELHKVEGTSIIHETDAVGRNHETVFDECNTPGESYDTNQRPVATDTCL